ncbi:MAG: HDOD domain-containing protein [Betaproteobacteria bacterium]|nr:HDOD domain-containing protein [Betaproteobacteria bacterium]MBK8317399.1 HDOD domain-containing protein [Betaproteobacteria bacterium]
MLEEAVMTSVANSDDRDKKGDELKAQRFEMLADIAKELSGEVIFPTYFDAVLRLRKVLQDSSLSIIEIAAAVSMEPLIGAKLLHLANSVAFNPAGLEVVDLKSALTRLGVNAVRTTAMSIVMSQLMRAKGMANFAELTHALWDHSIKTAAAARIIAKNLTRLNPEEAMLAGLIHDLGAFYMLYRATQYEELRHRPDSVRYLIIQWHESIGVSLLNAIGIPEEIVDATVDHDQVRPTPSPIRSLPEVVYVANMLAGGHFEWLMQDQSDYPADLTLLNEKYDYLLPEIDALVVEMRTSFS